MRNPPSLQLLASAATIAATLALSGCSGLIPTPTDLSNIQEVDRLCAKDGGIRVYEQVTLPISLFTPEGLLNVRYMEEDYSFESERTLIPLEGGRHIERMYASIRRKTDGKQLGEAANYTYSYGSEHVSVPFYKLHSCDGFEHVLPAYVLRRQVFIRPEGEPK